MKDFEFYAEYASTPLGDRFIPINFNKGGMMTIRNVWERMRAMDEGQRKFEIEKERLLELADEFYKLRKKKK